MVRSFKNGPEGEGGEARAFDLSKGLDLPLTGAPEQRIQDAPDVSSCAIIGSDYIGLKPKMLVEEGDTVALGQPIIADKRHEGVVITAPAGGRVRAINRGARRVLQSVVIQIDESQDPVSFGQHDESALDAMEADTVRDTLLRSGLWCSLRTRPYSKVPDPSGAPAALFVTATDTRPLAGDPAVVIGEAADDFANGLKLVAKLSGGPTYVCHAPGAEIPRVDGQGISYASFSGPHPAGLVGTHIHFLSPVSAAKTVWHIGYQDVIAIGALFRTGLLPTSRVVALCGPSAVNARLLRTRLGASLAELTEGEWTSNNDQPVRVISGDVLTGRTATGPFDYLGRFHNQITMMQDGQPRKFFGWIIPSMEKFATARVHFSSFFGTQSVRFSTSMQGSARAMVPLGLYEDVMPMDVLPTQLLRALLVMDTDEAQALGALELDEEDIALCSFVCMSKYEYGMALRANLEKIEVEG